MQLLPLQIAYSSLKSLLSRTNRHEQRLRVSFHIVLIISFLITAYASEGTENSGNGKYCNEKEVSVM